MKVYTKTGDKGTTALIGGKRVAKNNTRIEAYGTTDELIAYLGLLRDQQVVNDPTKRIICKIQEELMVASALLAAESIQVIDSLPKLSEQSIVDLENEIDKLDANLPELKQFLIPGGHETISICHVCRTICRRAERRIYDVLGEYDLPEVILVYFNRLSDYLFVLSRAIGAYLEVNHNIWKPVLDK
jgi:cob(I)alamin adenosyltransferase